MKEEEGGVRPGTRLGQEKQQLTQRRRTKVVNPDENCFPLKHKQEPDLTCLRSCDKPHLAFHAPGECAHLWQCAFFLQNKHHTLCYFCCKQRNDYAVCICMYVYVNKKKVSANVYRLLAHLCLYWLQPLCPANPHTACVHVNISQKPGLGWKSFFPCGLCLHG